MEAVMDSKQNITLKRLSILGGIWAIAGVLAVVVFWATWGHMPDPRDLVISCTLFMPFFLPAAFGGLFGKLLAGSTALAWALGLMFWPMVGVGHWKVVRHGSIGWGVLTAILVWLAGAPLVVFGTAAMGI